MNANTLSIEYILEKIDKCYKNYFKDRFNEYFVELDFKTILTYFSGMSSIVLEFNSLPHKAALSMCVMVECNIQQLNAAEETEINHFIESSILQKYKGFLLLCKELCNRNFSKSLRIKNIFSKEAYINFKIDQDELLLEISDKLMRALEKGEKDFQHVMLSIGAFSQLI